jgi:2-polyprenyl-6-methoxyphenol hydroxylase-like FAD-dependent oxidoreductase
MFDAIVVGARCAGAPAAMLLARMGYRVLLVDRASFPSDTISTHVVWPHGAEILERWGLLDRVAASGCPPVALNMTFDVGPFALRGGVLDTNGGRGGFCPRRTVLDAILVEGAVASGAELREGFTVEQLLWDDERVVGIDGRLRSGERVQEPARIVIGADGVHSCVARAVGAPQYEARRPLTTFYYSYYSGFDAEDIEQYVRDLHGAACFPTNDGLTLLAVVWPSGRFEEIRVDIEGHVGRVHASIPALADRLPRARREERWFGTAGVPNYFRKPYGPGWALVGDAGYAKDPITAQGISDAFLDAESLVEALDAGFGGRASLDAALAGHHQRRDARAWPMYEFTSELARLQPPPPAMRRLFAALHGDREATDAFYSAITGSSPMSAFMRPENIDRIVARAAGADVPPSCGGQRLP